ncbi:MAG: glycosyltransferase family 4 protein [Gemmatimonadaceae bacterium]
MNTASVPTLWVVSELYYPERTSTGHFLTGIAEGLASRFRVNVLCAQPTYSARGMMAPRSEVHNGVRIHRCRSTALDKNVLAFRFVNIATMTVSMFISALAGMRRGDLVLVVTNPPLLPYVMLFVARLRGARTVLLVHDVYPEVLVATGMIGSHSMLEKLGQRASRFLLRGVDRIVAIGRDMRDVLLRRGESLRPRIEIIPNWGDTDLVVPHNPAATRLLGTLHLEGRFVVQYLGNMGRTHPLDLLLDAAEILSSDANVHFLFCGEGARRRTMERRIEREHPANVTLLPPCSSDDLPAHLGACDLSVIALIPGMSGNSVPSRMYNVMAAGKPILAISEDDSELCRVVREEGIGWTLPATASPEDIAAVIREAAADRTRLEQMGERARRAAEERYSRVHVIESFRTLFDLLV